MGISKLAGVHGEVLTIAGVDFKTVGLSRDLCWPLSAGR